MIDALDVNGDGHADLVLHGFRLYPGQEPNPPSDVHFSTVLFRTGEWVFEEGTPPLPAAYFRDHADLDGDGDEDLVVTEGGTQQLTVYQNHGSGQYQASVSAPFDAAFGSVVRKVDMDVNGSTDLILPAFVDVDADGQLELLRCLRTVDTYRLYVQGITTNAISAPLLLLEQPLGVNMGTYSIPSDFDQDGRVDLLVLDRPSFYEYTWTVFRNNGAYPLTDGEEIYHGATMYRPYLFDEDGDGDDDLIMQLGPCLYSRKNNAYKPLISIGTFSVYPNPSTGDLIVDLGYNGTDQFLVEVFDVTGRMVLSTIKTETVFAMALGVLGQGAYTIRASSLAHDDMVKAARVVLVDE